MRSIEGTKLRFSFKRRPECRFNGGPLVVRRQRKRPFLHARTELTKPLISDYFSERYDPGASQWHLSSKTTPIAGVRGRELTAGFGALPTLSGRPKSLS
jgi:hypothetical protein